MFPALLVSARMKGDRMDCAKTEPKVVSSQILKDVLNSKLEAAMLASTLQYVTLLKKLRFKKIYSCSGPGISSCLRHGSVSCSNFSKIEWRSYVPRKSRAQHS